MKLAACFHSIIEVIDQVLTHQNIPADRLLHEYLRKRRFIGSHDRKFITEHLYSLFKALAFTHLLSSAFICDQSPSGYVVSNKTLKLYREGC